MSRKMTRRDLLNKIEGMLFDLRDDFLMEGSIEFRPDGIGEYDVDYSLRYESGLSFSDPVESLLPAPLPVDVITARQMNDASIFVSFIGGDVDYGDKPETAQVDEDGALFY